MQIKASAPGSLMLLGEHAVLTGKPALVCAVDRRVSVTLTPRADQQIEIESSLGQYATELSQLKVTPPFQFVLETLRQFQPKLKKGCRIEITSDFSDKIGLGSSAAVTVAMLAALSNWLQMRVTPFDLIRQGRHIIRSVQGVGSGADVAASVYGGMVGFKTQPLFAEKFHLTHPITVIYTGFKTPTTEVIQRVKTYFAPYPELLKTLYNSIGQCAALGIQYVRKEEWDKLGHMMNVQQGLMQSLNVCTPHIQKIIDNFRRESAIKGVKISGSGLGDCVVALGKNDNMHRLHNVNMLSDYCVSILPVAMTLQGVSSEKI